jgi:NAD(P)-dependent dehydrogenase (short-subunit alcohol dehydrogenase family)
MGLARDLAPIRVNAVCLGLIISEQVQTMGEATIKGFTANLPLPRGGAVEEVASQRPDDLESETCRNVLTWRKRTSDPGKSFLAAPMPIRDPST